jgi:hypothetical protein
VQWRMGELDDGADSLAVQLAPAAHWPNLRYSAPQKEATWSKGPGPGRRPAQEKGYDLYCCGRCKGSCYTAWAGRSYCKFKLR